MLISTGLKWTKMVTGAHALWGRVSCPLMWLLCWEAPLRVCMREPGPRGVRPGVTSIFGTRLSKAVRMYHDSDLFLPHVSRYRNRYTSHGNILPLHNLVFVFNKTNFKFTLRQMQTIRGFFFKAFKEIWNIYNQEPLFWVMKEMLGVKKPIFQLRDLKGFPTDTEQ